MRSALTASVPVPSRKRALNMAASTAPFVAPTAAEIVTFTTKDRPDPRALVNVPDFTAFVTSLVPTA